VSYLDSEVRRLRRDNIDRIYPERIAFFERWSRIWTRLIVMCALLLAGVVASAIFGSALMASALAAVSATMVFVAMILNERGRRRLPEPHDV
jgi:uncharacterized membrane protein YoaK (UPF0700 family)